MFAGDNIFRAVAFSWVNLMGAFDTEGFEFRDKTILYIIWFLHTLVTMFVLLNLLIAIMGDSFGKV